MHHQSSGQYGRIPVVGSSLHLTYASSILSLLVAHTVENHGHYWELIIRRNMSSVDFAYCFSAGLQCQDDHKQDESADGSSTRTVSQSVAC